MLDLQSVSWWKENGTVVRTRKRKAPEQVSGGKGKVQVTVVNNDAFSSFNNFLKNMKGKASSSGGVAAGGNRLGHISKGSDTSSLFDLG